MPDQLKATFCDDFSIVLFYQGEINRDEILFFDIPVPAELVDSRRKKRLSISLASDPEIQIWGLGNYHSPALKWRLFRGDVNRDEIIDSMSKLDDDHDDSEGEAPNSDRPTDIKDRFQYKEQRRSRGTIQHDWMEWTTHREEFSDSHYTLAISATKNGWTRQTDPSKFAVVVKLEDLGSEIEIYSKVSNEIETIIQQQAEARVET